MKFCKEESPRYRVYLPHLLLLLNIWYMIHSTISYGLSIFAVQRKLPMMNGESTEKDYYLNGGSEMGLKPGMTVKVTRQLAPYDSYQNKSPGELLIPVGELKIIFAQKGVSVAREKNLFSSKELPVLEDHYFMVGDKIDVGSASVEEVEQRSPTSVLDPR